MAEIFKFPSKLVTEPNISGAEPDYAEELDTIAALLQANPSESTKLVLKQTQAHISGKTVAQVEADLSVLDNSK